MESLERRLPRKCQSEEGEASNPQKIFLRRYNVVTSEEQAL